MPRVIGAVASRRRRKRRLAQAKGFRGARSKLFRQAKEAVDRAMGMAFDHRKQKKHEYRNLWVARNSAACRERDISYSRLIEGLRKGNFALNRKMLSEIAVQDPDSFSNLVTQVRSHLA